MILGIKQALSRKGKTTTLNQVFRYCGYGLTMVYFGHILATRGQTILYGKETEFESVAFTLSNPYIRHVFFAYYVTFISMGIIHTVIGFSKALQILAVPQMRPILSIVRDSRVLVSVILVLTTLGTLGILSYAGAFYKIKWVGYEHHRQHYEKLFNSFLNVVGLNVHLE
jgi:hypothetical protein